MMNVKSTIKRALHSALGTQQLHDRLQLIQLMLSNTEPGLAPRERTEVSSVQQEVAVEARNETTQQLHKMFVRQIVDASKPGTVFSCRMNGLDLLAPMELVRMYPHCLHPVPEQPLTYFVENQQSEWLCSKLGAGQVALDVGASMGLITLALSKAVGVEGRVHAFEPQRTSRRHLASMLTLNGVDNVKICDSALSNSIGSAEFIEYSAENELSWAAEASALASGTPVFSRHTRYTVPTTTIDTYVGIEGLRPDAIKIDIEGYELYALQGATATLERFRPCLCIDIHTDPHTGASARIPVETFLSDRGYGTFMQDHALYAEHRST